MSAFPEETKRYDDALDEAAFHRKRYADLARRIEQAFKAECNRCGKWKTGSCPADCRVDRIRVEMEGR